MHDKNHEALGAAERSALQMADMLKELKPRSARGYGGFSIEQIDEDYNFRLNKVLQIVALDDRTDIPVGVPLRTDRRR